MWIFSPWLKGTICAHEPHCSQYAKQCFQKYSFWQALVYSFDRVMTCWPSHMIKHDPSSYKVVFFSWAPIWEVFLRALHEDPRYDLAWVVTMPDAARDRWQKVKENNIKILAKELWLSSDLIHTPKSLRLDSKNKHSAQDAKETTDRLELLDLDYIVVVAYGKLLPASILDIPSVWPINVHGSLLPEYRGASPLQSVFLDGKKESWVTVMLMDTWLDTWDMLSKLKTPLPLSWTVKNLISWIQDKAPAHLLETLREYAKGDISAKAQDDALSNHCSKITKEQGKVDPYQDSLESIYQKYQAYALWPKTFFEFSHQDKVKHALIEDISLDPALFEQHKQQSLIQSSKTADKSQYEVNPAVSSLTIKPQGKKAITWQEFMSNYLTK